MTNTVRLVHFLWLLRNKGHDLMILNCFNMKQHEDKNRQFPNQGRQVPNQIPHQEQVLSPVIIQDQ